MLFCFSLSVQTYAAKEKEEIPKEDKWGKTNDRSDNSPGLFKDDSSVYVYSEKELDNLTIGITDMMGNEEGIPLSIAIKVAPELKQNLNLLLFTLYLI